MKISTGRVGDLDHLRGIAMLMLFLRHAVGAAFTPRYGFDALPWAGLFHNFQVPWSLLAVFPLTLGWTGLVLAFVISGFCVQLSHERQDEPGFRGFFIRRFFRLYPPYLLALAAFTLVGFLAGDRDLDFIHDPSHSLVNLGVHLFLVHDLGSHYFYRINPDFWPIAALAQVYLLFPLLLAVMDKLGWRRALWLTLAIDFALRAVAGNGGSSFIAAATNLYVNSPAGYLPAWFIGALLGRAFWKGEKLPFLGLPVWLFPALFLACYSFRPLYFLCFSFAALTAVRLLAGFLARPSAEPPTRGWQRFFWENLRAAGLVSYSAWLWHGLILEADVYLLDRFFPQLPALIVFGVCAASWFLCLALSAFLYVMVEKPSIALGRRMLQGRRALVSNAPLPAET